MITFSSLGFEKPDYDCTLHFEAAGWIYGVANTDIYSINPPFAIRFYLKDGAAFDVMGDTALHNLDLTKIKTPWFMKEDTFPCLGVYTYGNFEEFIIFTEYNRSTAMLIGTRNDEYNVEDCRPATKAEHSSLLFKGEIK